MKSRVPVYTSASATTASAGWRPSEQLLYSGAPPLSEEKYSARSRFREVLPILTAALYLISVEK